MLFFKHIKPFKIISFDLDDTLYDNTKVIAHAEQQFATYLQNKYHLPIFTQDPAFWAQQKQNAILHDPNLEHDVTALRSVILYTVLNHYTNCNNLTFAVCNQEIERFIEFRSAFKVSAKVLSLLNDLKQEYMIVALSNGNVDLQKIGLDQIFAYNLRPAYKKRRKKPYADLFLQLQELTRVKSVEILHVGDEPFSDIQGAVLADCQSAFLNKGFAQCLKGVDSLKHLPHVVLDNIFELRSFLHAK